MKGCMKKNIEVQEEIAENVWCEAILAHSSRDI